MHPSTKRSEEDDLADARVDHLTPEEPKPEDLPLEWSKEDRWIEGRKPDLGETEDDTSEV
jgi:hypothetical protein